MNTEKKPGNGYFAVIDTETTWSNAVMSIGVAIEVGKRNLVEHTRQHLLRNQSAR